MGSDNRPIHKFGYLFYDILFTFVPNVFQTPFQTCPLDLHTDAFYMSRASEINHRLVDIANGEAERIICEVHITQANLRRGDRLVLRPRRPCRNRAVLPR